MKKPTNRVTRIVKIAGMVVGLVMFGVAVWVLRRQFQQTSLQEILGELQALPRAHLWESLALTALGYLALAGQDLLALRYLRQSLSVPRTLFGSFIGYTFANNIPLSFLVGGTIRFRLYTEWGVAPSVITPVVVFNLLTYALGLATSAALVFIGEPSAIPSLLHLGVASTRPLGIVALLIIAGYLGWGLSGRTGHIKHWRGTPVPAHVGLAQIGISLLDWSLSGAALFVLLPDGHQITIAVFFGAFILGQLAALVAELPGGIGIFEAVMVTILAPKIARASVLGALVAYRVIYFLLPFVLAVTLLGIRAVLHLLQQGQSDDGS